MATSGGARHEVRYLGVDPSMMVAIMGDISVIRTIRDATERVVEPVLPGRDLTAAHRDSGSRVFPLDCHLDRVPRASKSSCLTFERDASFSEAAKRKLESLG